MARRGARVEGRRPRRVERSRILVVTEGVKTEVQYLEGLVQFLRSTGATIRGVRPKGVGKDPSRVVRAALDLNAQDPDGYDEVWVLVDVDEHTTLDDALLEARANGIPAIVSNPCFEIWLIWHYEDCGAFQTSKQAAALLERYGHTDKSVPNSFPYAMHAEASRRAGSLVGTCQMGPNPSTAMPHLLQSLRRAS